MSVFNVLYYSKNGLKRISTFLSRESAVLLSHVVCPSVRLWRWWIMYCRCVGGSVDPWPRITVSDSVALCGGMTVLSAPRSPVSLGANQAVRLYYLRYCAALMVFGDAHVTA